MNPTIEAERALVSACREKSNWDCCSSLPAEAFTADATVRCWTALKAFHESGDGDVATASHLRLLGLSLSEIEWLSIDASAEDPYILAAHIQSGYSRRQLNGWAKDLQDRKIEVEEFLSKQESVKDSLNPVIEKTYDFASEWYEEEAANFRKIGNYSTGFRIFDCIHRWVPGNLYLLTADTGKGKSFLVDAMLVAFCSANQQKGGLITLEMNRQQRAMRWMKGYSKEELANIYMPKRTGWDLNGIIREIQAGAKAGIKVWVVDHFHKIPNTTKMGQVEFENHAAHCFERLVDSTGVIIMMVCQMSKAGARSGMAQSASKHDIKGSKGIIDAAAGVFILDRGEEADRLIVDKNRFFGDNKEIGVVFDWKKLRPYFTDMETARKEKNNASFAT